MCCCCWEGKTGEALDVCVLGMQLGSHAAAGINGQGWAAGVPWLSAAPGEFGVSLWSCSQLVQVSFLEGSGVRGFIPIFHSSGRMLAGKGGSSCRCDADSLRLSSASEHPFPVAQLGKGRHSLCCPGSRSCWDIPGAVPAVGKESWNGSEGLGSDSSAGAQVVPSPGACR